MNIYKHNGEYWYRSNVPPWAQIALWLVHSMGLMKPHWTKDGYNYVFAPRFKLALQARGHRSRVWAIWHAVCPLSFCGGKITFQSWGPHLSTKHGYLCWDWDKKELYFSRNATPSEATIWLAGARKDVVRAAQSQADKMTADREQRELTSKARSN